MLSTEKQNDQHIDSIGGLVSGLDHDSGVSDISVDELGGFARADELFDGEADCPISESFSIEHLVKCFTPASPPLRTVTGGPSATGPLWDV